VLLLLDDVAGELGEVDERGALVVELELAERLMRFPLRPGRLRSRVEVGDPARTGMTLPTLSAADVTCALDQGFGVEDIRANWQIDYRTITQLLEEEIGYPAHRRLALRYAGQQRRRSAA
jgi:hypothetical protein